jgi:hypothetical protein
MATFAATLLAYDTRLYRIVRADYVSEATYIAWSRQAYTLLCHRVHSPHHRATCRVQSRALACELRATRHRYRDLGQTRRQIADSGREASLVDLES